MFGSLFKRKGKGKVILVFDIGSSEVSAGLVQIEKNQKPRIVYSLTKPIPFQKELNFNMFFTGMLNTLEDVARIIQVEGLSHLTFTSAGNKKIDSTYCILSSAWYVAEVSTIIKKEEKSFQVTRAVVDDLLKKQIGSFKQGALQEYAEKINESVRVVERSLMQIRLNGYETATPFGKNARMLEISFFVSIVGEDIVKHIDSVIGRVFHVGPTHYHTFSHVAFSVIRDLFPKEEDFIYFDMTGEITDVVLSKRGTLMKVVSFPEGKHSLMRSVAKRLATSPEEALSRVVLFSTHNIDESVTTAIRGSLSSSIQSWQKQFERALDHLATASPLPRKVFFTADKEIAPIIASYVKPVRDEAHLPSKESSAPVFIGGQSIKPFVSKGRNVSLNTFIGIEALFLSKVHDIEEEK